jgi:predicted DCC family thiol-disulfide oxidoreductase YuxK
MKRDPEGPVLLFDGVCNLCHGAVNFIFAHEKAPVLRFASLQSAEGQQLLKDYHLPATYTDSLVLIERHHAYTHSEAALRVSAYLEPPFALGRLAILIPRPVRDALYLWVASHRYQWFGKKDQCLLPTPERKARFLDQAA